MALPCPIFCLVAAAWLLSLLGTFIALKLLTRARILDTPSQRSNHKAPVPRGGGIAMIGVALWFLYLNGVNPLVIAAAAVLAIISFVDDLRGLPASVRFFGQIVIVLLVLHTLPGRIFPDFIPLYVEYVVVGILWLWFIDLTNFMDGIDGITSFETIAICLGICAIRFVSERLAPDNAINALILAASVLGFYYFNRSPARLFMGDVGSVTLGFLLGFLLLSLAGSGFGFAALILPAYYMSDASLTLLKRAWRLEKLWQAHSQHAYQQAVRKGASHTQVVRKITILNILLVMLAMLSTTSMMAGLVAVVAAYLLSFALMYHFTHALSDS